MELIISNIGALCGISTTEALIVVNAINAGMSIIAALGIVVSGGISAGVISLIRKAIIKGVGTKALVSL